MNMSAGLLCRQAVRLNDKRTTQLAENILHSSSQSLAFVLAFLANIAADHVFALKSNAVNLV